MGFKPSDRRGARSPICLAGLLMAVLCSAACSAPAVPAVSPADAKRADAQWPGTTVAQLETGRSLYLERCSSCHLPPSPSSLPPEHWPAQVEEMQERAGLDKDQAILVERYLITMAAHSDATP
jgi:hypothetical protein